MTSKDDTIAELRRLVEKQSKQIEAQGLRIEALTNEVEQLKLQLAKAAKDSSNSSKPPSSDFMNSTKQKKKPGRPRKKRVGGQPGHKRQQREPLQVPVSRGYLSKLCTDVVSGSLADAYEEVRRAIPQQPQLGSDETSFKNNGRKNWVWCISSAVLTVFHIATSRSRAVLEELVGDEFVGYMNFDYFSANCSFVCNYAIKAQYCWAHPIRDIRFLIEHPDKKNGGVGRTTSGSIATAVLGLAPSRRDE